MSKEKNEWRNLALQFDGHRMQAIALLRAMLAEGPDTRKEVYEFLEAAPLPGEQVLAQRLAELTANSSKVSPVSGDKREAVEFVKIEGYDAEDGVDGEHPRYGHGVFFTLNCCKDLYEQRAILAQQAKPTGEQ